MIMDEENISTETRIPGELFADVTPIRLAESSPTVVGNTSTNDTDDSFHSAYGETDIDHLIIMNSTEVKGNTKKIRKALGCIKNRLVETPKTDMRRKLWRNVKDERVKKGVNTGLENTPPFNDITASAPPKLYRQRYT